MIERTTLILRWALGQFICLLLSLQESYLMAFRKWCVVIAAWAALAGLSWLGAQVNPTAGKERGRLAFSHGLPQMDGAHLQVKVVDVKYGPGESSASHSHPCPVIGYVVEGSIRTQVKGEAEAIYQAGESFYEAPNGVHLVSANASTTAPARLLAYFICDHSGPLSVAAPTEGSQK
jgi:quercetin dioxygenase-like cupin family protein